MTEARDEVSLGVQRTYCTYFDVNYLQRGLALWRSLLSVSGPFVLWVCCLDRAVYDILANLALPSMRIFTVEQLEAAFPALLTAKVNRNEVEYIFTCTPSVVRYVLERDPSIALATYVDADLFFFADPEPLHRELSAAGGSVGIIAHRFPDRLKEREKYGIYNVGWVSFRRDARGLACLTDWQRNCIEWCYARVEGGKFADQKYLDAWPERFPGVTEIRHQGANVALWNVEPKSVVRRRGEVWIGDVRLIFYHFHALSVLKTWLFRTLAQDYGVRLWGNLRRLIYAPYLRELRQIATATRVAFSLPLAPDNGRHRLLGAIVHALLIEVRRIVSGEYFVVREPAPIKSASFLHIAGKGQGIENASPEAAAVRTR